MSRLGGWLATLDDALQALVSRVGRSEPGVGEKAVTVVSGLPRSGTSMMMRMLEAGGIEPLTDDERPPDPDNPAGYYEYEPVKELEDGQTAWLDRARGRAVKVISALVPHLPDGHTYRVILMEREIDEVLASQRRMLARRGEDPSRTDEEELRELFEQEIEHVRAWADARLHVACLSVRYGDIVADPSSQIDRIDAFLGGGLDIDAMASVVDPELYRSRG